MTEFKEIAFGSEEHDAMVELRRAILRRPLGLDFTISDIEAEMDSHHLGLFAGQEILACLIFKPVMASLLKMRQVAVRDDLQGQGVGRQLVEASEQWALRKGFREIELHARETAVPFYLRLGYKVIGEPFEEVGIPHRKMFKIFSL